MENNLVVLDEDLIARLSAKFCTDYLPTAVPTFILKEALHGKNYSNDEINAINSFIKHVSENWNNRVQKLEGK